MRTEESQQRAYEADDDETMAMDDPIKDVVLDEAVADPIEDVHAADTDNEIVNSQVHSTCLLQAFRSLHPAKSTEELARRWVNHMTGVQREPRAAEIEHVEEDGDKMST